MDFIMAPAIIGIIHLKFINYLNCSDEDVKGCC